MKYLIFLILILTTRICYGQKKPLGVEDLDNWPILSSPVISNDGNYFSYRTNSREAILQSLVPAWEIRIPGQSDLVFTDDSKYALFYRQSDTLCLLDLTSKKEEKILGASRYDLLPFHKATLLAYLGKQTDQLVIRNLTTGDTQTLNQVNRYVLSENKQQMALIATHQSGSAIDLFDLASRNRKEIWSGGKTQSEIFSPSDEYFSFIEVDSTEAKPVYKIWEKSKLQSKAKLIWTTLKETDNGNITGISPIRYNNDEDLLRFTLKEMAPGDERDTNVDIRSYADVNVFSRAGRYADGQMEIQVSLDPKNGRLIQLTKGDESILRYPSGEKYKDRYSLVEKVVGDMSEAQWIAGTGRSIFLVDNYSGERVVIQDHKKSNLQSVGLSPDGQFVIYYNPDRANYFSYNIHTKKTTNLTKGVDVSWCYYHLREQVNKKAIPVGAQFTSIEGWIEGTTYALINSELDLWKVDVSGKIPPINLTGKWNTDGKILFSIAFPKMNRVYSQTKNVVLQAFQLETKQQGFYNLDLGNSSVEKLSMHNSLFGVGTLYLPYFPISVERSSNNIYNVVKKENCNEFPNFYLTTDFLSFKQLTFFSPQKTYNWFTTELHSWKTFDGSICQGLLYKPENFDPNKKYPVIVRFYERWSDNLNMFILPEHSRAGLEVPFLVSNEYLVFWPDVPFKTGHTGESFYNSVASAVDYLCTKSFVDSTKIGVNGHSFGGYGVNYLITHTNKFAAALSGAGVSDVISGYNEMALGGKRVLQGFYENGQIRMGASLWERQDLYLENSPILFVDKITTPLLILHNEGDQNVAFTQGLNLFNSMRRLGKPCWMLSYSGAGHSISKVAQRKDYEFKAKEFFDYYLKNSKAPLWMTFNKNE